MMEKGNYEYTGKVKWAKVYEHNRNEWNKNTVNFYPGSKKDRDQLSEFKFRANPKVDEDGEIFWILNRRNPDPYAPGPLEILKDGKPFDKLIGNGSTVKVTIEVYPFDNKFGKGHGHRLNRVEVVDWVEYVRPENTEPVVPVEEKAETQGGAPKKRRSF